MHQRKKTRSMAMIAVAAICGILCAGTARAAAVTSLDALPEVVAKVNGKPILKKDIVPRTRIGEIAGVGVLPPALRVTPAINEAIDRELIAQQAAKEGLGRPPVRADQPLPLIDASYLADAYAYHNEDLRKGMDPELLTEADIDAALAANAEKLAPLPEKARRQAASAMASRKRFETAKAEWRKALLVKAGPTVNGEAIPREMIEAAADAWSEEGDAAFASSIREIIIAREADRQGVPSAAIEKDAAAVEALLSTAVLEGPGGKVMMAKALGRKRLAALAAGEAIRPVLFRALSIRIIAAAAIENGVDKIPKVQKELRMRSEGRKAQVPDDSAAVAELLYARHGLGKSDDMVSLREAASEFQWYQALADGRTVSADEIAAIVRDRLQAADDMVSLREAASEFQWYQALAADGRTVSAAEINAIVRGRLQAARLSTKREAYLQRLRAAAKIEYMVELE